MLGQCGNPFPLGCFMFNLIVICLGNGGRQNRWHSLSSLWLGGQTFLRPAGFGLIIKAEILNLLEGLIEAVVMVDN